MVDSSKPLSIEDVVKQTLAKMKQPAATQEPEKKEVEAKPEVKPAEKIVEVCGIDLSEAELIVRMHGQ